MNWNKLMEFIPTNEYSEWNYVYHQTSSENGEKAGLTCFKFSNIPLADEHTMTYFIEVV